MKNYFQKQKQYNYIYHTMPSSSVDTDVCYKLIQNKNFGFLGYI